jgi:hypothetical protein
MGVYHFAGLGKSIGAVTAAFSYLAARKQMPDAESDPLFALSGEAGDVDHTRGSVEALVLFTTAEIIADKERCDTYLDNRAGSTRGNDCSNRRFHYSLKTILKEELRPLARREKNKNDSENERTGPIKPLELYWCEYERTDPVQTFERVAQVIRATKAPGKVGKEIWVNLTGGSNIINGALQLAASLTGTPAQLYYLLSDDPRCIRHTVPINNLRTEQDHFWVNLPMVYLDFNQTQKLILQLLADMGSLTFYELHGYVQSEGLVGEDQQVFIHGHLRPLINQRLIVHEQDVHGGNVYCIGPGWQQARRYLDSLPSEAHTMPQSLTELVQKVNWFLHEAIPLE